MNTTNVDQGAVDVLILCKDAVDVLAQQAAEDGIDDDVARVEERHDASESADLAIRALHPRQTRLNKRSERDIASGPSHGDGDEHAGDAPCVHGVVGLDRLGVEREYPDDEQGEGVEAEEGEWRLDVRRRNEDEECAKELAEVGATDHNLRVGRVEHDTLGDGGRDCVFEITMAVDCTYFSDLSIIVRRTYVQTSSQARAR